MAICEYGALVTKMYGSIGGITFGDAQGLSIAKRKAIPRKRVIPKRTIKWNRFSQAVWSWKAVLTADNKQDWIDAAANFVQSSHGMVYEISGINLYIAHYMLMLEAAQTPIAAPTIFTGRLDNPAVAWSWDPASSKVKGLWTATDATKKLIFFNTDGCRPGATVRRTGFPNQQVVAGNIGNVFLTAVYTPSPGTLFIHWITVETRGSLSTASDTYTSYP